MEDIVAATTGWFIYQCADICPGGDLDRSGERCRIIEEMTPDEAGLPRYRIRFADGTEAEALEPELARASR
jgi:hypothetical protein